MLNGTEAPSAGNSLYAIADNFAYRKHSHESKASETARQYKLLSKLISILCAHKFGKPK
jgi:N-methylhydantoinase A/oxoprolinase/acetone carboxylase beta subunit